MDFREVYLQHVKKQFLYYKTLGEKAMDQLKPEQLLTRANEDSNSIAMIVRHMHGNMLSRWTDFLTTDGEKTWRNRDLEFEESITGKETVTRQWEEGWACLFSALNNLDTSQLMQTIYIRDEAQTVMEAINRQLAHYPYHVGQIIYAAKQLKEGDWNTLSIPKKKK
jgi:hypothetical protein